MTELWILAAFFTFVLAAVTLAGYFLMRGGQAVASQAATPAILETGESSIGSLVQLFRVVGENLPGAKSADNPVRVKLQQAGYRLASAVPVFYGIKGATSLTLGLLLLGVAIQMDANPLVAMVCAAGFGYMLPDHVLERAIRARAQRLRRALPSALDMLVLAIDAGQSIDQAMIAASRGLKNTYPDLASDLTALQLEARASNNRAEALRNFIARNREPELRKFAALLIDTDRFGTSVGPALRDHARYMRIRLRQQAQESARKVGVKLIFPVFFLIFPSVILVTLGPAVILIFTQLKTLLGN